MEDGRPARPKTRSISPTDVSLVQLFQTMWGQPPSAVQVERRSTGFWRQ